MTLVRLVRWAAAGRCRVCGGAPGCRAGRTVPLPPTRRQGRPGRPTNSPTNSRTS